MNQDFRFAILARNDYTSNRNNQSCLFHFPHLKRLQRRWQGPPLAPPGTQKSTEHRASLGRRGTFGGGASLSDGFGRSGLEDVKER